MHRNQSLPKWHDIIWRHRLFENVYGAQRSTYLLVESRQQLRTILMNGSPWKTDGRSRETLSRWDLSEIARPPIDLGTTERKRTQMPMYISSFAPPKAQFLCLLDDLFKRLHFNKKGITSSFLIQLILNLNMWLLNLQLLFQIFEWRIINGPKQTREKKFLLVFLLKLWIIGYFLVLYGRWRFES